MCYRVFSVIHLLNKRPHYYDWTSMVIIPVQDPLYHNGARNVRQITRRRQDRHVEQQKLAIQRVPTTSTEKHNSQLVCTISESAQVLGLGSACTSYQVIELRQAQPQLSGTSRQCSRMIAARLKPGSNQLTEDNARLRQSSK